MMVENVAEVKSAEGMVACGICGASVKGKFLKQHQSNSSHCREMAQRKKAEDDLKTKEKVDTMDVSIPTVGGQTSAPIAQSGAQLADIKSSAPGTDERAKKSVKKGKPSWRPSNLLKYRLKDKNYTLRFSTEKKLEQKLDSGWEPVRYSELATQSAATILDGKPLDDIVKKRELIAVKIPKDLKKARQEYYEQQNKTISELESDVKSKSGAFYGKISDTENGE